MTAIAPLEWRHPFGKVPVLDIGGMRIREPEAVCRYREDTWPSPRAVPGSPRDRARMNEGISFTASQGYAALIGVAGYHLFPDFLGGRDDAARVARSRTRARIGV